MCRKTSSYSYDILNRLTGAIVNDGSTDVFTEAFDYDAATGNLLHKGASSSTWQQYFYTGSQPHAVTHVGDANTQLYWYDANGNMTKRIEENNEERLLSYDAENRLVAVALAATPTPHGNGHFYANPDPNGDRHRGSFRDANGDPACAFRDAGSHSHRNTRRANRNTDRNACRANQYTY
jgi:YD repeat-containing protein